MRRSLEAIRRLEASVTGADWTEGVVLRYGGFYGPGTSLGTDGEHLEAIRRRRFPVVGDGAGVWSFVHIEDAAEATVAAIERGTRGIYNIVDDEPARVAEWLPVVASSLGARPPRRVPRRLGRLLAGEAVAVMMTEVRGASNAKAKRELGWKPGHPSLAAGDGVTELLDELRPAVFAIAYRMLGSVSEAEDVVQETLLRVHGAVEDGRQIESPRAYAATIATRLAIDELRSARVRRETYVGEWLPEPLVAGAEDDPARQAELADSLSLAFLVLLESLSPEQRAAFLLHDVFDYDYAEIARIVGKSEANARQLASRARRHVEERRPRFEPSIGPARRAGRPLLCRRARRRARRARGPARRGRRAARRRRRQGPGAGPDAAWPHAGGAHAGGVGAPGAARMDGRACAGSRSTASRARSCSTRRTG